MQPIKEGDVERMIGEAEAAGKDASSLKQLLTQEPKTPTMGEVKQQGDRLIISTGRANGKDFK